MSLNRAIFTGRIGQDLQPKTTSGGYTVVNFTVAVDRDYKDKGTGERGVDWIDVTAYRQEAEFVCRNFQKGSSITVDGRMRVDSYTDKDGNNRRKVYVLLEHAYFAGGKAEQKKEIEGALPAGYKELYGRQDDGGTLPF